MTRDNLAIDVTRAQNTDYVHASDRPQVHSIDRMAAEIDPAIFFS
ncbi:hypothetical protein [Tsuneonella dongtanensis]|nr:hypothetical protein [Tsuneonella dongtanensis]